MEVKEDRNLDFLDEIEVEILECDFVDQYAKSATINRKSVDYMDTTINLINDKINRNRSSVGGGNTKLKSLNIEDRIGQQRTVITNLKLEKESIANQIKKVKIDNIKKDKLIKNFNSKPINQKETEANFTPYNENTNKKQPLCKFHSNTLSSPKKSTQKYTKKPNLKKELIKYQKALLLYLIIWIYFIYHFTNYALNESLALRRSRIKFPKFSFAKNIVEEQFPIPNIPKFQKELISTKSFSNTSEFNKEFEILRKKYFNNENLDFNHLKLDRNYAAKKMQNLDFDTPFQELLDKYKSFVEFLLKIKDYLPSAQSQYNNHVKDHKRTLKFIMNVENQIRKRLNYSGKSDNYKKDILLSDKNPSERIKNLEKDKNLQNLDLDNLNFEDAEAINKVENSLTNSLVLQQRNIYNENINNKKVAWNDSYTKELLNQLNRSINNLHWEKSYISAYENQAKVIKDKLENFDDFLNNSLKIILKDLREYKKNNNEGFSTNNILFYGFYEYFVNWHIDLQKKAIKIVTFSNFN